MLIGLAILLLSAQIPVTGASAQLAVTQEIQSDATSTDAPRGLSPELQALVKAAEAEGAMVLVIGGTPEPVAASDAATPSLQARLRQSGTKLRERTIAIATAAPGFPAELAEKVAAAGPAYWPLIAAALTAVALLIGYLAYRGFSHWTAPFVGFVFSKEPKSRAEKTCYLLCTFLLHAIGLAVLLVSAVVVLLIVDYGTPAAQDLQVRILFVFGVWRLTVYFFESLLGSEAPKHRLLRLSDADAHSLKRSLSWTILIAVSLASLIGLLGALGIGASLLLLGFIITSFVAASLLTAVCVKHRAAITGMLLGGDGGGDGRNATALRLISKLWPVLAGLYFYLAWAVTTLRQLVGLPNASFLVASPFLTVLGAVALYGIALMLLDWAMPGDRERVAEQKSEIEKSGNPTSGLPTFRALAERSIGVIVIAAAVGTVMTVWGVDLLSGHGFLTSIWELVLIFFVAYLGYQAVKIAIDRKIALEGGGAAAEPGEEGGHGGGSRLATLLPLFRNFLLAVIVAMGIMIGLSQMGVDIAPLFAGAGVVGLAIGFGAQTLIKDIFSGAFFLFDDAFRVGEYIDIGSVKGTVEKISVRSMQLRHQLGTLVTVPFGEIQHLSNFSRDWVIMKLPLRLTYNTDINKVNKLIKNLGKELMNHELIGDKFLEPLKSQGVWMMEDSAMIIRVKFMTKPGDQFQVRKIAYAEIRSLFEREGIQFASREVKVRLDEHQPGQPLTEDEKTKVAAAVRPVLDEAEAAGGPPKDQR
ncbi:MAG: hypothetical protein Kilf2KO_32690 [Rhodospirillales bacterium]